MAVGAHGAIIRSATAGRIVIETIVNAADLLTVFGSGAKLYLDSATAIAGTYANVTSAALVSGTDTYELADTAGTTSTWYKVRAGNSGGTLYGDYSPPVQLQVPEAYTSVGAVKHAIWPGGVTPDAVDDDEIERRVEAANDYISGEIGYFAGPSADTTRTFDGYDAVRSRTRLWIPDGIRTLTLLEIADGSGGTFSTATASDYVLRPQSWELRVGEPFRYIQFVEQPTGAWSYFPVGYANVRATGTFGWPVVSAELAELATMIAVRLFHARATGQVDVVGTDATGDVTISRLISARDRAILRRYQWVVPA